jgi:hypothetical protein
MNNQIGFIKWYDPTKGFGIVCTPNSEIFIHQKYTPKRFWEFSAFELITFETETIEGRIIAVRPKSPSEYIDLELAFSFLGNEIIRIPISENLPAGKILTIPATQNCNLITLTLKEVLAKNEIIDINHFFLNYYDSVIAGMNPVMKVKFLRYIFELEFLIPNHANRIILNFINKKYPKKAIVFDIVKNIFPKLNFEDLKLIYDNNHPFYHLYPIHWLLEYYRSYVGSGHNPNFLLKDEIVEKKLKSITHTDIINLIELNGYELANFINIWQVRGKKQEYSNPLEGYAYNVLKHVKRDKKFDARKHLVEIVKKRLIEIKNEISLSGENHILKTYLQYEMKCVDNLFLKDSSEAILWKNYLDDVSEEIYDTDDLLDFLRGQYNLSDKHYDRYYKAITIREFSRASKDWQLKMVKNEIEKIKQDEFSVKYAAQLYFLATIIEPLFIVEYYESLPAQYKVALFLSFPNPDHYGHVQNHNRHFLQRKIDNNCIKDILLSFTKFEISANLYWTLNQKRPSEFRSQEIQEHVFFENSYFCLTYQECTDAGVNGYYAFLDELIKQVAFENKGSIIIEYARLVINTSYFDLDRLVSLCKLHKISNYDVKIIYGLVSDSLSPIKKIELWIDGQISDISIESFFDLFSALGRVHQNKGYRKIFSLAVFNSSLFYQHSSSLISIITDNNLDINIVNRTLKVLTENGTLLEDQGLADLFLQFVKEDIFKLIEFGEFVEMCPGRAVRGRDASYGESWRVEVEGKDFYVLGDSLKVGGTEFTIDKSSKTLYSKELSVPLKWKKKWGYSGLTRKDKPKQVEFCDAVKTQKNDENDGLFFWCCNSPCYAPMQTDHISLEWEKYSLRDFIKILNINFDNDKYYRFVSLLNRAHRLLQKLKCHSCNSVLRDSRTSEFAFYRVTSFYCINNECSEFHNVVYLNHCFNWKCQNIIDSRISSTCPNGWYICDLCNSCCSQKKIDFRYENLISTGGFNSNNPRHLKLKLQVDNRLGHLERDEKFNHFSGKQI